MAGGWLAIPSVDAVPTSGCLAGRRVPPSRAALASLLLEVVEPHVQVQSPSVPQPGQAVSPPFGTSRRGAASAISHPGPRHPQSLASSSLSQLQRFTLRATISSGDPSAVHSVLVQLLGSAVKVAATEEGFELEAEMEGESARDLNRSLLSALRRAHRRTRLRAEWTAAGRTERFFDYTLRSTRED